MKSSTDHRSRSTAAALAGDAHADTDLTDPAFAHGLRERLRAAVAKAQSGEQLERMRHLLEER